MGISYSRDDFGHAATLVRDQMDGLIFKRAYRGPKVDKNGRGVVAVFADANGQERNFHYPTLIKLRDHRRQELCRRPEWTKRTVQECPDPTLQKLLSAISAANSYRNHFRAV